MLSFDAALFQTDRTRVALEKYAAVTHLAVRVYDRDERVITAPTRSNPLFELLANRPEPYVLGDCVRRCFAEGDSPAIVVENEHSIAVVGAPITFEGNVVCAAVAAYALVGHLDQRDTQRFARNNGLAFHAVWDVVRQSLPIPRHRLPLYGELLRIIGETLVSEHQRSRQLEETLARLEVADRRKDEFLALLSHELRNPLQVLCGVFDLQRRSDNPEMIARIFSIAERQAKQLHRLVDDLLNVSRISQGKLELRKQRVDLASVVNLALESGQPALDGARHTLTLTLPPEPVYLDADSARLAQVLTNLLNNAAKYTDPGGSISLNAARNGSQIVIRIRDNGRGIAPEHLPHIFDMFKQAETRHGGLGIGLSLVKQLVEMHGGQVWAHSAGEGQGSEFVVQLPLATDQISLPPTRAAEPDPTAAVAAPARRILVVDDNIDAAESLAESVRLDGHVARTAYTGKTAVETALEFGPDIICLDIDLPDVSGYEVAERLRRELPNLIIVAVSGWLREDVPAGRKSTAIDQYFLKPVNFENLRALIAGNSALKA